MVQYYHPLVHTEYPVSWLMSLFCTFQELHTNQEAVLSGFDDEGLSAIVTFSSSMESVASDVQTVGGSMKTWLVRGMVSVVMRMEHNLRQCRKPLAVLSAFDPELSTEPYRIPGTDHVWVEKLESARAGPRSTGRESAVSKPVRLPFPLFYSSWWYRCLLGSLLFPD